MKNEIEVKSPVEEALFELNMIAAEMPIGQRELIRRINAAVAVIRKEVRKPSKR